MPFWHSTRHSHQVDCRCARCFECPRRIVEVSFDGTPAGEPFDTYGPGVNSMGRRAIFGEIEVAGRGHTVTLWAIGKNAKSEGMGINVKRIMLSPIQ